MTIDTILHDKTVDNLVDNQNFLLKFANKVIETFFDSSGASVQPSLIEFSGSNDLTIVRVDFDFEISDWWKVFREVGLETLPSFFCKHDYECRQFRQTCNSADMTEHKCTDGGEAVPTADRNGRQRRTEARFPTASLALGRVTSGFQVQSTARVSVSADTFAPAHRPKSNPRHVGGNVGLCMNRFLK